MKNKDIFTLNPDDNNLINKGVVEINTAKDAKGLSIIRHELKTFVCEGEYQQGIYRILKSYLENIDKGIQPPFWVSGFFGSGKSHLVKMLGYLWEDFTFPNGDKAKKIKTLPQDISDLFYELEIKQKIYGKLSVSGTLKDFPSTDIRYSFLKLFLSALGLPQEYHHFNFVKWAKQEGLYDQLKAKVEADGKDFQKEYENHLYVSSSIAKAILELAPNFAESEAKVKEYIKLNFRTIDSISQDKFVETIKSEILPMFFDDKIPLTLIVLDEVQQFIGNDGNKTIDVQNLAQDLRSNFDGKFLLIGTGQNALTETPSLQPLKDRFYGKVGLSDTDVETVTRKTVLDKKPSAFSAVDKKLEDSLGEISRNLSGTDFGYVTSDRATLVADYPILPSTRKFWKKILQVIDTAGTSGQLRSQLRIVDESLKKVANNDLGTIVSADLIFEQKQSELLTSSLLLNETNNLILSRKSQGGDGALEGRILSVVFLIDILPKDTSGMRLKSDEKTIAELLIDNLNEPSDKFRIKVKELIAKLADEKILMPVDDEYKLQTKIGQEWEQEYTRQVQRIVGSGDDLIQNLRKEKLVGFFKDKTKTVNITHGVSKQNREFELWDKATQPSTEHKLNLWIRDGWYENESTLMDEIRAAGSASPMAFVFVKKLRDPELRSEIIKFLAAGYTLDTMGMPSSPEAEQAKKSMETRKGLAKVAIDEILEKFEARKTEFKFSIPIEIISPNNEDGSVEEFYDYIPEICSARNNNVQLKETAKGNQVGYYDHLKELLDEDFDIIWKTGDAGKIKSEDVISLASLSLIFLQENNLLPTDIKSLNKISIYSQKNKCIDFFSEVMSHPDVCEEINGKYILKDHAVKSALSLVKNILPFFDKLYIEFPNLYHSAAPGKFGRISCVEKKQSRVPFYSTDEVSEYQYPFGFFYPLICGITHLMKYDPIQNEVSWKLNPINLDLNKLDLTLYVDVIRMVNYDPQRIGKGAAFYSASETIFDKVAE